MKGYKLMNDTGNWPPLSWIEGRRGDEVIFLLICFIWFFYPLQLKFATAPDLVEIVCGISGSDI